VNIAWGQLGLVLVIGLIAGAGVVVLFAVGVALMSRATEPGQPRRRRTWGAGIASLCFAICLAVVVYGIYLLIPALH
jgi:hypothetical protein